MPFVLTHTLNLEQMSLVFSILLEAIGFVLLWYFIHLVPIVIALVLIGAGVGFVFINNSAWIF